MKCPLVCVELKATFPGFSIACLTRQETSACIDSDCRQCPTGKDIKNGKRPKILPDGLTLFRKNEMPKNWKPPKVVTHCKLPYGVNRKRGKSKYPFYRMQTGEIVFLDYAKQKTARSVIRNFSNKTGWKFVTQKEGDKLRIERII